AWALSGFVVAPLRRLAEHARVLGRGDLSTRIQVDTKDEIGDLAAEFNDMTARLQSTTVSKDYVTGIIASMMDPLLVIDYPTTSDSPPRITAANNAACGLLGCREEQLLGRPVDEIIDAVTTSDAAGPDDSQAGQSWLARIRLSRPVQAVELNWRASGG